MPELKPLDIDDLKKMLGERDIIIEQFMRALTRLEASKNEAADAAKEPEGAPE